MNMNKQQGASVLEFTIVIPVLLMFLILVSEVGIMFYTMNALTKSTQNAARYLSEEQFDFATDPDGKLGIAKNLLIYGSVLNTGTPLLSGGDDSTLLVVSISKVDSDTHVSVITTYQHDLIMGTALGALTGLSTGGSVGFGNTFNMQASSVMRFVK